MEKITPHNETNLHPEKKQLKEEILPVERAIVIQIADFFGPSIDVSTLEQTGTCVFERGKIKGALKKNQDGSFSMIVENGAEEVGAIIERLAQGGVLISGVIVPENKNMQFLLETVVLNAKERYFNA